MLGAAALSACGGGSSELSAVQTTATPAPFPRPFNPTATPGGQEVAAALNLEDFIQVENAAVKALPPGECYLVERLVQSEMLSAARVFDYKLRFGFGCPSTDGNLRMDEVRFQTSGSVATYDSQCATSECDPNRVTPSEFDSQRAAIESGQTAAGWTLLDVEGRKVLARSIQMTGAPVVIRQYAEFCGDVRVENRIVMLGDNASSLDSSADSFFTSLSLACQSG